MNTLSKILRDNRFQAEDVSKFENKLFYEGNRSRPYLERFFALLLLATIIATAGIIADSLPGVVISISLVPPLCVVGLSLSAAEMDAAFGAMLLLVTNFLAILLAGGAVLGILRLNNAAQTEIKGTARRKAFALVFIAMLLVAVPLLITGQRITQEAITELQSQRAVIEWGDGTEYRVRKVRAVGDSVYIVVIGHGDPAPFEELVTGVETEVGRKLSVDLEMLPSELLTTAEQ